jgi:hypothetical protein
MVGTVGGDHRKGLTSGRNSADKGSVKGVPGVTTFLENETAVRGPEPPTRERIEQARQEQLQAIEDLRRRILNAIDRPYEC